MPHSTMFSRLKCCFGSGSFSKCDTCPNDIFLGLQIDLSEVLSILIGSFERNERSYELPVVFLTRPKPTLNSSSTAVAHSSLFEQENI